jgi:formylglycine-generating enzyme required for sulfatase activity
MEYDVFISYSRSDEKQIEKFVSRLEDLGFRVWIDRKGIESGDSFKHVIVNAIEKSAVFVYFNSTNSVKSPWTTKELGVAIACNKPIIPVKLDKASYSKEDMFDLINLDYIDYSDPITHESMMEKFISVVISKCPERWEEIQAERAIANGERGVKTGISTRRKLACILLPPLGLAYAYVAKKNNRKKKSKEETKYSIIGFAWVLLAVALLLVFRPFTTAPSTVTTEKDGENWYFNVNGVPFKMVYVEGGTYLMGSSDNSGDNDEVQHQVTLSSFYIMEVEVTRALWYAVMEKKRIWGGKGQLAMEMDPEWKSALYFISRLNQLTSMEFRLPTEAEWEYAARGGKKSEGFSFAGSDHIYDVAWFKENGEKTVHKVKGLKANELGLYDMSGNLKELCSDYYAAYDPSPQVDPEGPSHDESTELIVRGGSYRSASKVCRVSYRSSIIEDEDAYQLGLRLVLRDKSKEDASGKASHKGHSQTEDLEETLTFDVRRVSFDMKLVEGATFEMGGYSDNDDATPVHKVTLNSYYIGETEITQELWEAVMGTSVVDMEKKSKATERNGLHGVGPNYPMYYLNWYDCQDFLTKLNAITDKNFRLPTEAEWEFAARGGRSKGYKFSGSNSLEEVAWYKENSKGMAHPVKQLLGNALGIYDMNGNVWEWCQDYYDDYEERQQYNPTGPVEGDFRVSRGASWNSGVERHGVSSRNNFNPERRHVRYGLRIVLPIEE